MNLLEIFAKLGLDSSEYDKGLSDASSKAKSFGSKIGSGLATAAKVGAAAVGAAATAVGALVKQSVDAYGSYEQLVGGVETLFGDSAGAVLKDAQNAFKTAGMSMNEYMETSIQSAASLINSLDGDQAKAAELMNVSITDMADNVNKMGTSMEGVQNAYRGFSRGNFTMLDNLALGFAGTKAGMEELLEKAEEYAAKNGEVRDYSIDSYADIVEAIHVVQKEMKISGLSADEAAQLVADGVLTEEEAFERMGTTAKEASGTIQGSLSSVRSAWQNLITGLADENADFDTLVNNLVSGVVGVVKNMAPRIQQAIKGVGQLVKSLAPVLAEEVPKLVSDLAPSLFDAAVSLLESLGQALGDNADVLSDVIISLLDSIGSLFANPQESGVLSNVGKFVTSLAGKIVDSLPALLTDIISGIGTMLPTLLSQLLDIIITLINGISGLLPTLIPQLVQIVVDLFTSLTNPQTLTNILQTGITLFMALLTGIKDALPAVLEALPDIIENLVNALVEGLPMVIDFGLELVETLFDAIVSNLDLILDAAVRIIFAVINGLVSMLPELLPVVFKLIVTLTSAMIEHLPEIIDAGIQLVEALIEGILGYIENVIGAGMTLVANLFDAIVQAAADLIDAGKQLVEKVKDGFMQKVEDAKQWGKDLISGFISGILEKWENLKSKVTGVVDKIKGIFTGAKGLDTHSPSKWAEKVFKNVMEGAEIGVDTGKRSLFDTTDDMVADLQNRFNNSMTVTAGASDGSVYALLAQYLPQMANQRIVLDSGTLVGELTPGIDTALGQRAAFAQRRAAT